MIDNWLPPRAAPLLARDEIHVWCAMLDGPADRVAALASVLSDEERERADRFYAARERDRFVVARGLLRTLLGNYRQEPPASLRLVTNEDGKPFLDVADGKSLLFNLSHSEGLALYVMSRELAMGVDVERIRADVPYKKLAARFFSPVEREQLDGLPEEAEVETFFQIWTCKEAYIKGRGTGLRLGLDSFDVTLREGGHPELVATRGEPEEAAQWQLRTLQPRPGYVGAVAVKGANWELKCWSLR